MNILIILALLLPRSEAAQESDEGEARRLLLLGRLCCSVATPVATKREAQPKKEKLAPSWSISNKKLRSRTHAPGVTGTQRASARLRRRHGRARANEERDCPAARGDAGAGTS